MANKINRQTHDIYVHGYQNKFRNSQEAFEYFYDFINRYGYEQSNTRSMFNVGFTITNPEEIWERNGKYEIVNHKSAMIEFAKLHVEAALKEAFLSSEMRVSENDTNEYPSFVSNYDDGYVTITVSKDSILNAYPLENII